MRDLLSDTTVATIPVRTISQVNRAGGGEPITKLAARLLQLRFLDDLSLNIFRSDF